MRRSLLAAILLLAFMFSGAIGAPPAGAVAPANDNLGAALEVAFQPYTNVQTNIDATLEVGENAAYNACQGEYTGAGNMTSTVWYKYTHLGSPATLQVDTLGPGTMDAVIRIATGPSSSPTHGSLTEIACGDQEWGDSWAAATFSAATGQTYYIQVGTYSGFPPGTFALNISPINSTAGTRFTVTSNADTGDATPDGACDSGGACTLREAIQEANALVGTDVITFEAGGGSPVTIAPATPLPVASALVIDARTENAFSGTPAVVLDGISVFDTGTAFSLQLSPVSVRGLVIGRFIGNAFLVQSNNNVIQGNYLGVNAAGVTDFGNVRGVYVTGGRSGNIIGGTTVAARNVISGNALGVFLDGSAGAVTNNRVIGNYIGTNAAGTSAIQNDDYGIYVAGVAPAGATGNIIGDSTVNSLPSGGANLISGNDGDGVRIFGSAATGNTVAGNVIGLNAAGTAAIPNTGRGVNLTGGASSNTVGGNAGYERNVISGNALDGVRIADAGTTNSVMGNYVGTDVAGNVDLGNGGAGIAIENAPGNIVGGSSSGPPDPPGNVVSGNVHGITIFGEAADGNVVQGNVVGLNAAGNAALGNSDVGIWVLGGADNNIIGGTVPGARNISSANARGIAVFDTGTTGNTVQGNYAGTNLAGTAAIGNASEGVGVGYGASGNLVGGSVPGAGNVLSGNGQNGVRIGEGNASNSNTVAGNYIGTNAAGTSGLANGTIGVWVLSGSTGNTIGDGNVISGNSGNGVQVDSSNTNTIRGNYIGTNASGTGAIANGASGVLLSSSSSNTIGGSVTAARNVISGNAAAGVTVTGGSSNTIKGNYMGLATDGQGPLPNAGNGIRLDGGALVNVLGGIVAADANVISANTLSGVQVTGEPTDGNLLIGNLIGTDATGTLDRGNILDGVRIDGGADNTGIGNGVAGGGNVISGNNQNGINITGDGSTGTEIWGNKIGTNSAGTAAIANSENGILVWGAVNTSIGGNTAGKRNVISGNASFGVFILPQVTGVGATGNIVRGNYIGTQADGKTPLGNSSTGITLFFAPSNTIGGTGAGDGNTIAYNGGNGVTVDRLEANGNLIQRNSIHGNGIMGIDLINGANGGILPPTILSFNPPAAEVVGETCPFCTVEVFSDSADEGRVYQGTTTADFLGDWVVSASFLGPNITATTTNGGNTSEFSAPFACPDSDADTVCDAGDNCPAVANTSQSNADGDALGDHCDTSDTDGDGFTDQTEARYVGTNAGYPCGFNSWPADLLDQGPLSANKITLQDLASFVAPVRHLNTNLGDGNFSARWDLVPGKGTFPNTINLQDMAAIVILAPPMLNGARALNGPVCPMPSQ